MAEGLIAGVDIGGTKTRVMARLAGRTVADEAVPTDSWRVRHPEADARALTALVRRLCGGADPEALAVGAHGCDTARHCAEFEAVLAAAMPAGAAVRVVNDSELLVPAAGFADGIGVVAGTGSIAVARTADGRMLTAGGWGWILGDEGSAPALVREAARAVRGALDLGQGGDPLVASLMRALGTDDPTMMGRLLDATRGAVAWGGHADTVFAAAREGSALARRVIAEGGRALAALVGVLAGRGADATRVVAGGSVIVAQPTLMDAFTAGLREASPATVEVALLREPPVVGAVAIARRLLARAG